MLTIPFLCPLPNGLHARPAWALKEQCSRWRSDIHLINHRLNTRADAKSTLALVSTGTLFNDSCSLEITGTDAEQARRALENYLEQHFIDSDSEPSADSAPAARPVPRSLARLNPCLQTGVVLATGIGHGVITLWHSDNLESYRAIPASAEDIARLEHGLAELADRLNQRLGQLDGESKTILSAHLSLIQDDEFVDNIRRPVRERKLGLGAAIVGNMTAICEKLAASDSDYLRERASDIRDISEQLLHIIWPQQGRQESLRLTQPTLLLADDVTPSQFLGLDLSLLKGMILEKTGRTSHTLILARAASIPVLSGLEVAQLTPWLDKPAVLDGQCGVLAIEPDAAVMGYYAIAQRLADTRRAQQARDAALPAASRDGTAIDISANIGSALEAPGAFANGAQGIGLFRSEMLYLDRDRAPEEQEQFEAYQQVLMAAGDKPVIFRTMDIGGDKQISYLNIPQEENPFLGYRAVRIYPEFASLFRTQLRAILRAAVCGNARLMIPMVHSLEQILWVKNELREVRQALQAEGVRCAASLPLGIMVEVPAVCYIIDHFCDEVDFFSIGSNDMTQYLYAVDRNNPRVSPLYNPITPSFLRMLRQIIDVAHRHGKWVGICGELGGESRYLPLLFGLNFDELSMSGPHIPAIKSLLRRLDASHCRQLAQRACDCRSGAEIEALLDDFTPQEETPPLLALENILFVDQPWPKEQVIQLLCGNLAITGRTDRPQELEEDIWQREEIVTTGVGFGVAIPHAKSPWVRHASISIARLPQAIDWHSEMGEVELVIMLTPDESAGINHIKVFAQLARRLMNNAFRQALLAAETPQALLDLLQDELHF